VGLRRVPHISSYILVTVMQIRRHDDGVMEINITDRKTFCWERPGPLGCQLGSSDTLSSLRSSSVKDTKRLLWVIIYSLRLSLKKRTDATYSEAFHVGPLSVYHQMGSEREVIRALVLCAV
jgi:hypothetical protein